MHNRHKYEFKELFMQYYEELVIYAENHLFNRSQSEDLVQEMFIYLWENAEKINIKISTKSYLYKMVRNRCINYLKAQKITDRDKVLELMAAIDDPYYNDEVDEEKVKKYNSIMHIVENQMPGQMKEIFKLKYLDEYSYAQITEKLKISLNTVKTQLQRAKKKIAEGIRILFFQL